MRLSLDTVVARTTWHMDLALLIENFDGSEEQFEATRRAIEQSYYYYY